MRFLLAGQPNSGKSTIFNAVAGYRSATANFPGSSVTYTVSRALILGREVEIVDLPGMYSMTCSEAHENESQCAILNQDYSTNTPQNRAARNSIVQIFATGEGQTNPSGIDGKIAVSGGLPEPNLPVTVKIGGIDAAVHYAGAAPGLVAGVIQINAQVPGNVASGSAVPIEIRVGSNPSRSPITLAIQ